MYIARKPAENTGFSRHILTLLPPVIGEYPISQGVIRRRNQSGCWDPAAWKAPHIRPMLLPNLFQTRRGVRVAEGTRLEIA